MPDLSVVIPTRDRNSSLRRLLLALGEQSLEPSRFEVIVAIDGQATGTEAVLDALTEGRGRASKLPYCLSRVAGSQAGPGAARNRGAAAAAGRLLLFLDDDMAPTTGLLAEHLLVHHGRDGVIGLGRVQLLPEHRLSPWERYLNGHFEDHYRKMDQSGYSPSFWDCLSGNLSLSRSLFLTSRGFDPVFGEGKHEDIELGYRLSKMGVKFQYRPGALSYHRFCKDLDEGLHDARLSGSSTLLFLRLYPELFPQLLLARWQRYPGPFRRLLASSLSRPSWRQRLVDRSRRALSWVERIRLAARLGGPPFRLAYHLHFWHGLAETAAPEELQNLCYRLRA
jgi:glycosyltransferase involved in cell wall biosynthesis